MLNPRNLIAIDTGRQTLRAVLACRQDERLEVRRVLVESVPDDVDPQDPQALGAWIGRTFDRADFPRGRVTISLPREHVGVKRITLPTVDPHELPQMTRLAMQRELPFDAAGTVIDYVPTERGETSTTVLAVVVPASVMEFNGQMLRSAGLGLERAGLQAMGAAALLDRSGETGDTLVVDVTGEGVELGVVRGGAVRFSRAAELAASRVDETQLVNAISTETRRTWMSYRIVEDSGDLRRAVLLGDPRVLERLVSPLAEMLQVDVDVLDSHRLVDVRDQHVDRVWPLVGLLMEDASGAPIVDFAHPRKVPDLVARRRKRAMLAAGLGLVLLGGAWTIGRARLDGLETRLAGLEETQRRLAPQYVGYFRDSYRLAHLRGWESADVDWLRHASYLADLSPPPESLVLDSWTGTIKFSGVRFDRKEKTWSAPRQVTIVLDGDARDRGTADAFRETLVATDIYTTSSTGADTPGGRRLPVGFTYRLRTEESLPEGMAHNDGADR